MFHTYMLGLPNHYVKHDEQKIADNVNMTLQQRINEIIDKFGVKPVQLAKIAGVSRATVSDWKNGNTSEIKYENAQKISVHFNIELDWVMKGNGSMKSLKSNVSPGPNFVRNVPLISWISAGSWCEAIDNYAPGDAEDWFPCVTQCSKHSYALRVYGDSMTNPYPNGKNYPEGTIIYIDPEKPITNGCRVIAKLPNTNEATFKQYVEDGGKKYLKPLNPQYPMIEIDDDAKLCGVIIGSYLPE